MSDGRRVDSCRITSHRRDATICTLWSQLADVVELLNLHDKPHDDVHGTSHLQPFDPQTLPISCRTYSTERRRRRWIFMHGLGPRVSHLGPTCCCISGLGVPVPSVAFATLVQAAGSFGGPSPITPIRNIQSSFYYLAIVCFHTSLASHALRAGATDSLFIGESRFLALVALHLRPSVPIGLYFFCL